MTMTGSRRWKGKPVRCYRTGDVSRPGSLHQAWIPWAAPQQALHTTTISSGLKLLLAQIRHQGLFTLFHLPRHSSCSCPPSPLATASPEVLVEGWGDSDGSRLKNNWDGEIMDAFVVAKHISDCFSPCSGSLWPRLFALEALHRMWSSLMWGHVLPACEQTWAPAAPWKADPELGSPAFVLPTFSSLEEIFVHQMNLVPKTRSHRKQLEFQKEVPSSHGADLKQWSLCSKRMSVRKL